MPRQKLAVVLFSAGIATLLVGCGQAPPLVQPAAPTSTPESLAVELSPSPTPVIEATTTPTETPTRTETPPLSKAPTIKVEVTNGPALPTLTSTDTPTEQPTLPSTPGAEVTGQAGANVREGPGTNYGILEGLKSGDMVTVVGRTANGWYEVVLPDGETGFVSGGLLQPNEQASGLPTLAPAKIPTPPLPTQVPPTLATKPALNPGCPDLGVLKVEIPPQVDLSWDYVTNEANSHPEGLLVSDSQGIGSPPGYVPEIPAYVGWQEASRIPIYVVVTYFTPDHQLKLDLTTVFHSNDTKEHHYNVNGVGDYVSANGCITTIKYITMAVYDENWVLTEAGWMWRNP